MSVCGCQAHSQTPVPCGSSCLSAAQAHTHSYAPAGSQSLWTARSALRHAHTINAMRTRMRTLHTSTEHTRIMITLMHRDVCVSLACSISISPAPPRCRHAQALTRAHVRARTHPHTQIHAYMHANAHTHASLSRVPLACMAHSASSSVAFSTPLAVCTHISLMTLSLSCRRARSMGQRSPRGIPQRAICSQVGRKGVWRCGRACTAPPPACLWAAGSGGLPVCVCVWGGVLCARVRALKMKLAHSGRGRRSTCGAAVGAGGVGRGEIGFRVKGYTHNAHTHTRTHALQEGEVQRAGGDILRGRAARQRGGLSCAAAGAQPRLQGWTSAPWQAPPGLRTRTRCLCARGPRKSSHPLQFPAHHAHAVRHTVAHTCVHTHCLIVMGARTVRHSSEWTHQYAHTNACPHMHMHTQG